MPEEHSRRGKMNSVLVHFVVWATYVCIAIVVYGYGHSDWIGNSIEIIISHLISAGVFYTTALFVFPKLFDRKRYFLFAISLVCILAVSCIVRFFFAFIFFPEVLHNLSTSNSDIESLIRKFFFQWFTFSLYSLGFWQSNSRHEIQRTLAKKISDEARQQKLELENAALRAQINPHFIFNTLEHFRSQTIDSNPETSFGLGSFMQILRAGITKPGTDGKIFLELETAAIEGTIYIFKQRFPNMALSHISQIEDADKIRIMPHLLLPIVENAFKHGAYDDLNNKIKIELYANKFELRLFVSNKKSKRIKDLSTGIGLKYVKRHLEIGYQNRHTLIINQNDERFVVDLSIQLN